MRKLKVERTKVAIQEQQQNTSSRQRGVVYTAAESEHNYIPLLVQADDTSAPKVPRPVQRKKKRTPKALPSRTEVATLLSDSGNVIDTE